MHDLLEAIEARLRDLLVPVDVLLPWTDGSLQGEIHKVTVLNELRCDTLQLGPKSCIPHRAGVVCFQLAWSRFFTVGVCQHCTIVYIDWASNGAISSSFTAEFTEVGWQQLPGSFLCSASWGLLCCASITKVACLGLQVGVVESEEFLDEGMQLSARVPMSLASRLQPMLVSPS